MFRVQLFITCLIDSLFPEVGEAVIAILKACGVEVCFQQEQTCCGQPPFNAGFWDEARKIARKTICLLEHTDGFIIVPSGSCAHMLRHGYLQLFADETDWLVRAENISQRTFELSEFMVDKLGVMGVAQIYPRKLVYHSSCHLLRGLGVNDQPLRLLHSLEGAEVVTLEQECCGFGGVFAVDHSEISAEILKRKLKAIDDSGAEVVVGCDVSCLMHIEGGLRKMGTDVHTLHLAQVLVGQEGGLR